MKSEKTSFEWRVHNAAEAMCDWRGPHHPGESTCRFNEELARTALIAAGVPTLEAAVERASLMREAVESSRAHVEKIARDAVAKAEHFKAENAELRDILDLLRDALRDQEIGPLCGERARGCGKCVRKRGHAGEHECEHTL